MVDPIESDTDGIYFIWDDAWPVAKLETDLDLHVKSEVNSWCVPPERRLEWGIDPEIQMEMDSTLYKAGWFYKQKTYILTHQCKVCKGEVVGDLGVPCIVCDGYGDAMIIKGGSFNSQRNCVMFDQTRDKLARLRIANAPHKDVMKVLKHAMAIHKWLLTDLTIRLKLTKDIDEYSDSYWGVKIANRAYRLLGIIPEAHYQYEFVYADNDDGIELLDAATIEVVSHYKYREMIGGIAERFGYLDLALPLIGIPPLYEIDDVDSVTW